jgi:hypothetical protein
MLHAAGDEPEHKMRLCQSSLSRGRSAHNMQMFWHKIPGSVFSHAISLSRNFELNSLKETKKSDGGQIFWILLLCLKVVLCNQYVSCIIAFFYLTRQPPWARASPFTRFLDHTQRRNTVGTTPLDEWSACRTDLYLTTHNRHPCPRWDSNSQSQQASDLRPTP